MNRVFIAQVCYKFAINRRSKVSKFAVIPNVSYLFSSLQIAFQYKAVNIIKSKLAKLYVYADHSYSIVKDNIIQHLIAC